MPVLTGRAEADGKASPDALQIVGPRVLAILTAPDQVRKAATRAGNGLQPAQGLALIDTGASHTCVDMRAAEAAGLPIFDVRKISSATEPSTERPVYAGQMSLPDFGNVTLHATGVDIKEQGVIALIGRDLLKSCVFVYNGQDASFSLSI